jgi:glycine betaine catabolism B
MIKYPTDKQLSIRIIMFDSNRNENNTLYKKESDECINANGNLKIIYMIAGEGQGGSSSYSSSGTVHDKGEVS